MGVETQNWTKGSISWIGLISCVGPTHQPACRRTGGGLRRVFVFVRGRCAHMGSALRGRVEYLPASNGERFARGGKRDSAVEHAGKGSKVQVALASVHRVLVDLSATAQG